MNIELSTAYPHEQADALRQVQEAVVEHARTRRDLDAALAAATAAGVPAEALHEVGQCEPGHGRHAGEGEVGASVQFEAFAHAEDAEI
ncbi:hypothetical protein ACEZDB_12645 [Streptacidiphilus sp. N1-3]|uniref:Uncharacterized protein n=1 Tax=Streptacidiphilus alkalitolerans TaxID=3342712 RepID=A0ABV6WZS2_9ACTN